MTTNSLSEQILNELGEEFAERIRRGENPSISDYTNRYPADQAREIEEFLDSIAMLEDLKRSDSTSDPAPDAPPENFGRYRIERSLGEGGMGAVYLAHDSQLDRKVAIKTPKFERNSDPNLISRFYREARSAATLQHPNICPVYDVGEIDGLHYISMAFIEGRPLSDYIKSKKQPPVASVVRIVRKVALALHEAHEHGVVHRDLKPANIMISRRNEPIVMDFGLARQFGGDETDESEVTVGEQAKRSGQKRIEARLTQDGTVMGSPGYMSPEQLQGDHAKTGPAADIYALGVLLYELLTRQLPFPGDGSLMSIVNSVMFDAPPDLRTVRPQLDRKIAAVCRKAMAKKAEDRYESMQAFAVALTEVLKSDSDDSTAPGVSDVTGLSASPDLVRTKEQYELARSLYQENQFTAAVSILEKMVAGSETPGNQFTDWAKTQLPKAKAKAKETSATALKDDSTGDDDFWNQDFGAAAVATTASSQGPTQAAAGRPGRKRRRRRKKSIVRPLAALAVLLIAALVVRGIWKATSRRADNTVAKSQQTIQVNPRPEDSTTTLQESPPDDSPSTSDPEFSDAGNETQDREPANRSFVAGRPAPGERLWRLDTNRDGKISKAELSNSRLPLNGVLKRVVDNFDSFDRVPRDGVLDRSEVQQLIRKLPRPGTRDNRRNRPLP